MPATRWWRWWSGFEAVTLAEFTAWATRLGLGALTAEDLADLHRGWLGLQPQLDRVREGLTPADRLPPPPLGLAR